MNKIVLMYHDVYVETPFESGFQNSLYKISVDVFEKQVKALVGYCKHHQGTEIEFTFDDGGVSFYTVIAPILERYGLRGIFFISTKYINSPLFLNSSQVLELHRRGHIIASHSYSHPDNLASLSEDAIHEEWSKSKKDIESIIDNSILLASIPNGYGSRHVISKAYEAGIRILYTSVPTIKMTSYKDMKIIGRYVIYNRMSSDYPLLLIKNKVQRRKLYVRWLLINIMKFVLGNSYSKLKRMIAN